MATACRPSTGPGRAGQLGLRGTPGRPRRRVCAVRFARPQTPGGCTMRTFTLTALAVCLAAAGPTVYADKDAGDKAKVQGAWRPVSGEEGGKPDNDAKEHVMTFKGDRFTVKRGEELYAEGTYTLDPSQKPRAID